MGRRKEKKGGNQECRQKHLAALIKSLVTCVIVNTGRHHWQAVISQKINPLLVEYTVQYVFEIHICTIVKVRVSVCFLSKIRNNTKTRI